VHVHGVHQLRAHLHYFTCDVLLEHCFRIGKDGEENCCNVLNSLFLRILASKLSSSFPEEQGHDVVLRSPPRFQPARDFDL